MTTRMPCLRCNGTGWGEGLPWDDEDDGQCDECKGSGWKIIGQPSMESKNKNEGEKES